MRILYIVGRLGMGGDSSAIFNTLDSLIERNKIKICDVDFLTHDIGYNVKKVGELREKGHNVYILPGDVRKMGPIGYYVAVRRLLKEKKPYDVVHTHTSLQSGVALFAAKMSGVPKRVCHAHTNTIQRKTSVLSKFFLTPLFKALIDISATDKVACGKMAGEFLYGKHEFKILKNGIELDKFKKISEEDIRTTREELTSSNNSLLVGHIGRFSEMKNQKYSISLAEDLKKDHIKFVLVGDGEEYEDMKQSASQKGVWVEFLGRRSDIPQLLMAFDVLVLPSLDGEGFPVTLVEAQAAGCPCIVSTNVTREADLGLNLITYVDLENQEEWKKLICERTLKKMDRSKSIEYVEKLGYSQEDAASEWFRLYEGVV